MVVIWRAYSLKYNLFRKKAQVISFAKLVLKIEVSANSREFWADFFILWQFSYHLLISWKFYCWLSLDISDFLGPFTDVFHIKNEGRGA